MKYTVVWLPSALDRLAELWNEGPNRGDLSRAANEIDTILAHDPVNSGESREGGDRILICHPLAVYLTVSDDDRLVEVFAVWRWDMA